MITQEDLTKAISQATTGAAWSPHAKYSVFTQYDQNYYRANPEPFLAKYRTFWAIASVIAPDFIIELGTHAGSGADAYLCGARAGGVEQPEYLGIDVFCHNKREDDGSAWLPMDVAQKLFADRGFRKARLLQANLRSLNQLPPAPFVVVDAAHDFENEYKDILLAMTARPQWMFIDDSNGPECRRAIDQFLSERQSEINFIHHCHYQDGGVLISFL